MRRHQRPDRRHDPRSLLDVIAHSLREDLQVLGVGVPEAALHRIQRLGDLVDVLADRQQLVVRAHERGHAVLERGRVDRFGRRRLPMADEVTQHQAQRCRPRTELSLRLDLL